MYSVGSDDSIIAVVFAKASLFLSASKFFDDASILRSSEVTRSGCLVCVSISFFSCKISSLVILMESLLLAIRRFIDLVWKSFIRAFHCWTNWRLSLKSGCGSLEKWRDAVVLFASDSDLKLAI